MKYIKDFLKDIAFYNILFYLKKMFKIKIKKFQNKYFKLIYNR